VSDFHELAANLWTWLFIAAATAVPALVLWLISGRRLFLAQRQRAVPWSGAEVFLVLLLALVASPSLARDLVHGSGLLPWLYGPSVLPPSARAVRSLLWTAIVAFPFEVGTVLWLLRAVSGTRPDNLGFATDDTARDIAAGWLGWFLITPSVLAIDALAIWFFHATLGFTPDEHPFVHLAHMQALPIDYAALLVAALIAAPVWEELLFRGVLQRWLATRCWCGARLAIVASSLLFAGFHAQVWPTPIPLFFLALGLGWLAQRTQSLLGPIVLHALFNSVACLMLLTQPVAPAPEATKGNATTSTVAGPPAACTSSFVPGSWLPRRT
jgi:membrane protease YdiL (CAAX protease family)